jgi:hypothetical protein
MDHRAAPSHVLEPVVTRLTRLRRRNFAVWAGETRRAYRQYGRAVRRTHDAKFPGPSGWVRAGNRVVAPHRPMPRIALRAAPSGLPRPHATQECVNLVTTGSRHEAKKNDGHGNVRRSHVRPGRIGQVFMLSKKSSLFLEERSLSSRNSMASTVPIGARIRRNT